MPRSLGLNAAVIAAIGATGGVALWGFVVDPVPGFRWLALGGVLPTLWAFVELTQERGHDDDVGSAIMRLHKFLIVWASLMLTSRVGVRLAIHEGLLSQSWLPVGQRFNGLLLGIGFILFGNYLPRLRSPWLLSKQPFAWQQVHRFVGWTFVLGGLCVIGATMTLPLDSAVRSSMWIVVAVCIVSLGRKFGSLTAHAIRPL